MGRSDRVVRLTRNFICASRRLKLKLTVQKEVMNGAVLQEAVVIEYVVRNQQCPDCQASFTTGAWKAIVQVRGKHCVG